MADIHKIRPNPVLGRPMAPPNPAMMTAGKEIWRRIEYLTQTANMEKHNRENLHNAVEAELKEIRAKINEIIDVVNAI